MNEKDARAYAASHGVSVSTMTKGFKSRTIVVGEQVVGHLGDGGKSCWRVNGESVGRIGDALKRAVDLDIAVTPVSKVYTSSPTSPAEIAAALTDVQFLEIAKARGWKRSASGLALWAPTTPAGYSAGAEAKTKAARNRARDDDWYSR